MRTRFALLLGFMLSCDGVSFCGQDGDDYDDSGGGGGGGGCCVRCTKSKPCGNSCIAFEDTCHVGDGCACFEAEDSTGVDALIDASSG